MIAMTINSVVAANVRRLRRSRNISVSELARRSGVAKATLSNLETGEGNPTVQTLTQLAEALGVLLGDLLEGQSASLIRRDDLDVITDETSSGVMLPRMNGAAVDMYDITFRADTPHHSRLQSAGAVERVYVVDGELAVEVADEEQLLRPGDMSQYDLSHGATLTARGGDARVILLMTFPQPGIEPTRR